MVTSTPGQNKAHTKALAGSVPGVPPPLELAGTQGKERAQLKPMVSRPRHLQGGRQAATQQQRFAQWKNDPPSSSRSAALGSTGVRASEPSRLALRGWKQSPTRMDAPGYTKK